MNKSIQALTDLHNGYMVKVSLYGIYQDNRESIISDKNSPFYLCGITAPQLRKMFKDVDYDIQHYVDNADKPGSILSLFKMWEDGTIPTAGIILASSDGHHPANVLSITQKLLKAAYDNCCFISRQQFGQEFDVDAPRSWEEVVNNPQE